MADHSVVLLKTQFTSYVELLRTKAALHPQRVVYKFLQDGESEELPITYEELDHAAREIAAHLQQMGMTGERALLMYPPGLEYIKAFYGCLYAGVVAVPAYPPRKSRNMLRLHSIVNDAQTAVIMTTQQYENKIASQFAEEASVANVRWLSTDALPEERAEQWVDPQATEETLAFLQYTSGSTSAPKGVMVNHGNLLHNELFSATCLQFSEDTVLCSWVPMYHDMGLIGTILLTVYLGATAILLSPIDFLQQPFRWLKAISTNRATFSAAPNFAFDLCVRKITEEQKAELDLSSWRVAINGAEPVRAETLKSFAEAFAGCGFRAESLHPSYGLAEHTLIATGRALEEPSVCAAFDAAALEQHEVVQRLPHEEGVRTLVGCGHVWLETEIKIVDPETMIPCPPNRVGEIWLKGPSVAQGYWNRPEQSNQEFRAYTKDENEGPFLRTGDLGFLVGDVLFVTGRKKDLIVLRGKNFYPQDIEYTVEQAHPAIRESCSAAFSLDIDTEERLVVAAELERTYRPRSTGQAEGDEATGGLQDVVRSIRKAVMDEFQVQPYAILLLRTGSIPKTSSGKIQRHACKQGYLNNTLDIWGE
ncbi:MAG: fatty acyl-AMP ligase [Tumebacillaceae bacterium]